MGSPSETPITAETFSTLDYDTLDLVFSEQVEKSSELKRAVASYALDTVNMLAKHITPKREKTAKRLLYGAYGDGLVRDNPNLAGVVFMGELLEKHGLDELSDENLEKVWQNGKAMADIRKKYNDDANPVTGKQKYSGWGVQPGSETLENKFFLSPNKSKSHKS